MENQSAAEQVKIRPKKAALQATFDQYMTCIAEIGRVVNADLTLDVTLNTILRLLKPSIDYTAAEILLWHEESQTMVVCAQVGDQRYTAKAKGVYTLNDGYTGWIASHWQPLLIVDAFKRQDIQPKVIDDERPIRSFLGVPLQGGNNRFGTIELVSDASHAFDRSDLHFLDVIGQYVVTAIKNSQLVRTEQVRADYLAAIHQVSLAANSTLDSSELLRRSLIEMLKVINLNQGEITLFDYEGGYGYTLIRHPADSNFKGLASPIPLKNNPLIEWVIAHKQPFFIEDARLDPRLAIIREAEKIWEIKSWLLVPLVVKEIVIGTINLYAIQSRRHLSDNELDLVSTMASQVSQAIGNVELYEQLEKQISVLHTLYGASRVIISSLELDEILRQLVRQAWNLTIYRGKKISLASIRLIEKSSIKLVSVYPPDKLLKNNHPADLMDKDDAQFSTVEAAIKTGKPQLVGNISRQYKGQERHTETHSELAVPIKLGDEVVGAINVEHVDFHAFDLEDLYALEFLAAYAAIAIQNARLFRETRRHARLLQAAAKVAREAISILDENKLLDEVVYLIIESFNFFYHAGVFLLDDEREYAILRSASSEGGKRMLRRGHRLRVGQQGIVGVVAQSGQYRLTPDVKKDTHHYINPDLPETRAEMAFPLITRQKVIGVLDVQSTEVIDLSEEDIATLQTMADQLANAIYNAQLYRSEQQYMRALEAIQANSAAISAILELDKLLLSITERTADIFSVSAVSLMLWDDREEKLVIRAAYGLSDKYKSEQHVSFSTINHLIHDLDPRPMVFDLRHEPLGVPELIKHEGLYNVLVAPLTIGQRLIGALNIYSKNELRQFDKKHEDLATILASHAAIAIENAQRYETEQRRVKELSGLNRISQTISALTDIHQVYQLINMSIAELADAEMCAVLLYDEEEEALVCQVPAYGVSNELGRQYSISLGKDSVAYTLWKMQSYFILNNIFESSLPAELGLTGLAEQANVRDTLLIKLTVGSRDIGVLQASNKRNGARFNQDDGRLLSIFAGQAAAVIENARLYEELRRAMGLVSARTGLAWMGMADSAWRHAVDKHALTIREQTQLLRRNLKKLLSDEQYSKLENRLSMVERLAGKILEKPLTLPLSAEAGIESVAVNELISERAEQLWHNDPYHRVQLRLDLTLPATATIRVSREWLRRAFDILIDNAVNAIARRDIKKIEVSTRLVGREVEIGVSDTGPGLPSHILEKIGVEFIDKPENAEGLGMGLLMAQTIVQTYGGQIRVGSTGPSGTTMIIALPLERKTRGDQGL